MANSNHHKCVIIGSGPAGYTAAIYAARADLHPLLYYGAQPGGQLTITTDVENYPGYPDGIMGPEMMEDFRKQAERFGTTVKIGEITSVDFSSTPHKLVVDKKDLVTTDSVIIATGASAKWLGLEAEKRLGGYGVSACAVCDGFFYKGQDVAVVGGGDTAAEEASYLAKICKSVKLIVRKDVLRASKAMQHRLKNLKNVEILYNHETKEILGEKEVTGALLLNNKTKEDVAIDVTGFFIAIGHQPNTELFKEWLDLDEVGYIRHLPDSSKTKINGVFVAGDAADKIYRQAITAAGTGCMAALDAERYLTEKGLI